jgi:uncharacterized protein (DUF1919 family)
VWKNPQESISFVFVGQQFYNEHKTILKSIEDKVGTDKKLIQKESDFVKKHFETFSFTHDSKDKFKVKFINKYIHQDDYLSIVLKRLCVYLKGHMSANLPDDIYIWTKRPIAKTQAIVANFIANCFQNSTNITFSMLKTAVKN